MQWPQESWLRSFADPNLPYHSSGCQGVLLSAPSSLHECHKTFPTKKKRNISKMLTMFNYDFSRSFHWIEQNLIPTRPCFELDGGTKHDVRKTISRKCQKLLATFERFLQMKLFPFFILIFCTCAIPPSSNTLSHLICLKQRKTKSFSLGLWYVIQQHCEAWDTKILISWQFKKNIFHEIELMDHD